MNNLSITPGTNNVGAYINDIDLKNLDQNKTHEIKNILNQFGVIFIKEQNLDPSSYQSFAKSIGQPVVYPRLKGLNEKFPFINIIERKPDDKNLSFGSSWLHQDTSYLADNRFLMGATVTLADLAAYVEIGQLQPQFTNVFDLTSFPNVGRWLSDMSEVEGHDDVHVVLKELGDISQVAPDMGAVRNANKQALRALKAKLATL